MTGLSQFFSSDWAHRLGWTLLHSLWEIALMAASITLLLAALRHRSANARYLIATVGLLAMVALPVVTYCVVPALVDSTILNPVVQSDVELSALPHSADAESVPSPTAMMIPVSDDGSDVEVVANVPSAPVDETPLAVPPEQSQISETSTTLLARVTQAFSPWMPWLVIVWLLGVSSLSVWNFGGWIAAQRLKHLGTAPVGGPLADRLAELARRMRVGRRVQMVKSCLVDVPIVVGWLRPVILMPVGILTGFSPAQLDAILAHELAHIRRHDYLINLFQALAETLLFYHPGVWWISRQIRIEREHCCDDAAVSVCGNEVEFAAALVSFEEFRSAPRPALAVNEGNTLTRVRRILGTPAPRGRLTKPLAGSLAALAIIGAAACLLWSGQHLNSAQATEGNEPAPFVKARIVQYFDADGQFFTNGRKLTINDAATIEQLTAFLPDVGKGKKSDRAAGWESSADIRFDRKDKSTLRVATDFDHWSETHGDWPVRGDLAGFVEKRFTEALSQARQELTEQAIRLKPVPDDGTLSGQQTTGLNLSELLNLTGQWADANGFIKGHRFFERDVKRLVERKRTWALCALLDPENVDAKIHAARGLLQLADPESVPVILAAAKRNNYPVDGSESATVQTIYRRTLKEALEKITGEQLTPAGLRVTTYPTPGEPKVIRSEDDPSFFREAVDFAKVDRWLSSRGSDRNATSREDALSALAADADRIVLVEKKPDDPAEVVRALKGSTELGGSHSRFERLLAAHREDLEGPRWIMFLRETSGEGWLGLKPATDDPNRWLIAADPATTAHVEKAIPLPDEWSKPVDGVSIGVRARLGQITTAKELILEVALKSSRPVDVWNHRYNIYDYWPFTTFEVTAPSGKRFLVAKPEGVFWGDDYPGRCTLAPDKPYVHAIHLYDWAVYRPDETPHWKHDRAERIAEVAEAFAKPGKYTFRAIYESKHKRGDADFIGRLVSPPVTVQREIIVTAKDNSLADETPKAEEPAWGEPIDGIRIGLAPDAVTLDPLDGTVHLVVWYENTGTEPRKVPEHRRSMTYQLMFAGQKDGKPFYTGLESAHHEDSVFLRELKPGERFSEPLLGRVLPLPRAMLRAGYVAIPQLAPVESLTLRAGWTPMNAPKTHEHWKLPGTRTSGSITIGRAVAPAQTEEAGANVAASQAGELSAAPAEKAVAPADVSAVIVSLRSQLVRIGAKYPELATVGEIRIEGSIHGSPDVRPGYGFEYLHQCKYLGKRGFEDTGPKAASIKFLVAKRRNKGEEFDFATQIASHVWPNLNLFGWTHLHVGSSPSPGFRAEIDEILKGHVAMMNELDRRAAGNPVEEVFTKVHDVGGLDIEAGFVPDASSIMLRQPSFVTFRVTNRSGKPYQFDIGGDNRGSVRHNDFRITAVDAAGRAVRDPYSYTNFGGMVQRVTLAPGKTHSQRLYLGHWLDFARPGQYTVTCKRTLEKHGRGPQHPPLAVSSQFTVTVTPQDAVAMAAVIARHGKQIREGEVSRLREATIALADVDDVRVIPHLAASLARGDYQNRIPAIKGLGRYGNDAAVEALRSALTDNDHAVRSAAGQALQKCDKGDQVARQLLKQLASDSADVRRLAARALGETGSEAAIEPLIAVLKDPTSPVRCAAAVSLGELGRGEAADPLRQSLKRDDRALRVAAADGLRRLTGRFDPKWVTATIRETTDINDRTFHESIRLTRLYAGSDAAAALIGCLRFDDPSPRGSYNFYLILAIHHCKNGPDCYYRWKHDLNRDGTKEEIENNRKILDELKQFVAEASGEDEIDARQAANRTTERTQQTAETGPNVDTSLTDNPRQRFLEIEHVARLPEAEQVKELKRLYTELAPRYMNPFVTGILSYYPRHILNRADTKHYDGNSERWTQQLEDAAKDMSPEEVADNLDIGLWLNIAAQARALQVLRRHEKAVTAMIAADLATRGKVQVERAAGTVATLGLHAFIDELLALLLANGEAAEAAHRGLLFMRDPEIAKPLLEHVAKDPSSLARCAGLLQGPLYGKAADPLLLKLLEAPDEELRYHAARAVYECRDPRLAPFVAEFANDDEVRFRVAAAYMVRNLPDDSFISVRWQLLPLLRDKDESVRFEAVRSFGQKRDLAAGPVIIEALRREQLAEGLKTNVMQALNALTGDTFNYDTHNWGPSGQRNEEAMRKLEEWLETSLRALGDAWYVGGDAAKTMSKRVAAEPVEKLTGVVIDEKGRPLEGVTIKMCGAEWFDEGRWHRNRRLACYFPRPTVSATAGRFTVLFRKGLFELPFDEKTTRVNLWFDRDGFAPTYLSGMSPRPHDVKVVMKRGIRVSGTVKRLENGKPVPVPGAAVSLQCSSGDLAQQKRFFDDPLSTMKDTLEGCDLPYRKRVSTDVEGRYTFRLSPLPDDKKWCLFCSGQAVMLDVKQGQRTQGPDFVVEEEGSDTAELKLLRGENAVKLARVREGQNAAEILNALGHPDYVDDDPWFSYKASPEGSYALLFEEQVSKTDAKPDLASVTLWGVRGPGTDAREGVFLLPRRLSGAACGDFIALRVRSGPGLKKVATVAVGMSSSDVLRLFRPVRSLAAKEGYVIFPSIDDGEFLLVFSAREDDKSDDSASDRLSEVIYRLGGHEKPIYLLPFKKRGQTVPAEHKAFLENNRIRGNGNETSAAAHGTTGGADAPQHHGRISGVVVDGQEAPVAGAAVVLCRQATGVPFAEEARQTVAEVFLGGSQPTDLAYALTDEQGRFSFAKIPAGEYRLVAQSWPNADSIESLMAVHGAVLRLHGIVEHVEVTAESSPEAVIRPLGSGVLRMDEDMPNDGTLLVLSTAAPRADPVLGFVGWGGPFMHNLIGGTHMPAGKITVHGLPEGKLYIALFANDNRPGFGGKQVDIQAGKITDAYVPIVADWSNGHRDPPKRLVPLVEEVRSLMPEKNMSVARLLETHGIRLNAAEILQSQQQISEHLSDEIKLPTGRKTTFADFMAAVRYVELQQSAKPGSTGGL